MAHEETAHPSALIREVTTGRSPARRGARLDAAYRGSGARAVTDHRVSLLSSKTFAGRPSGRAAEEALGKVMFNPIRFRAVLTP